MDVQEAVLTADDEQPVPERLKKNYDCILPENILFSVF